MPIISKLAMAIHFFGFFAIIIPLWTTSPHGNARDVLLDFTNLSGWPTTGLASMIGLVFPITNLLGFDCIAHMCTLRRCYGRYFADRRLSRRNE